MNPTDRSNVLSVRPLRRAEVAVDGFNISYVVFGEGPPVVYLHGMGSSAEREAMVSGVADVVVASGRCLVAVDGRGSGGSSAVREPADLRGRPYVRDVLAVLDAECVDVVDLVGYSMGAGQALRLSYDVTDRVRSATMGGLGGIALAIAGFRLCSEAAARAHLDAAAVLLAKLIGLRSQQWERYVAAMFEALAAEPLMDVPPDHGGLPPMRFVVGEHDNAQGEFSAYAVSSALHDRVYEASRVVVDRAGHVDCVTNPAFAAAALAALELADARGGRP